MAQLNIKIVGLGEGGTHAVNKIISSGVGKNFPVEFIAVGNDENIMLTSATRKNIFLNRDLTTIYKSIADALNGANLIFMLGGLGGNAARSAVHVITSCAKNLGAITVAFMCRPSVLENLPRKINAEYTLKNLRGKVDTPIAIPAEKFLLFRLNQPQVSLGELFEVADEVFCKGVEIFLSMLPDNPKFGDAAFGYGEGTTALGAIKSAAKFPTLEDDDLKRAGKIFVRLSGGNVLPFHAVEAANNFIKEKLSPDAEFSSRTNIVPALGDKVFASIILSRKEVSS